MVCLSHYPRSGRKLLKLFGFHGTFPLQLKVLLNEGDVFRKNFFRFNIEGIGQDLANFNSNSLVINYLPIGEYTITASYYTRNGGGV